MRGLRPAAGRHRQGDQAHQPASLPGRAGSFGGGDEPARRRPAQGFRAAAQCHRGRLHQLQALHHQPADRPPHGAAQDFEPPPVSQVPAREPDRDHGPVRGPADPRHQLLPRAGCLPCAEGNGLAPDLSQQGEGRAAARLGGGLLHGRGGVLDRHHGAGVSAATRKFRADSNLRDRRQRRGPRNRPGRESIP